MTLKEAMKRIEELERKVRQLEARREQHVHYHAAPYVAPVQPFYIPEPQFLPYQPYWNPTCAKIGAA